MIRQPTPLEPLYAWHRAALVWKVAQRGLGPLPPGCEFALTDEVQLGWYKRKLIRDGVFVAGIIFLDQVVDQDGELTEPERVRCLVDGREFDPDDQWMWLCSHPITADEFDFMTRTARWARVHARHEPEANPTQPIDWLETPIAF